MHCYRIKPNISRNEYCLFSLATAAPIAVEVLPSYTSSTIAIDFYWRIYRNELRIAYGRAVTDLQLRVLGKLGITFSKNFKIWKWILSK
jgi:hypothetical protein